jgi:hypothetical protein
MSPPRNCSLATQTFIQANQIGFLKQKILSGECDLHLQGHCSGLDHPDFRSVRLCPLSFKGCLSEQKPAGQISQITDGQLSHLDYGQEVT